MEFDAAVDGKRGHQALYEMLSSINMATMRIFDVISDAFGVAGMKVMYRNGSPYILLASFVLRTKTFEGNTIYRTSSFIYMYGV